MITHHPSVASDAEMRRRAEEYSRVNRELMETVVQDLPVGVALICGRDLTYQLVNPAYQAIAPAKPMLGRTADEVWPENSGFSARCREVLASGAPFHAADDRGELRRGPDGPLERAYFSWSLHRVRMPGHEGWGLLVTAWETTGRKRDEEALRESEERYRAMVNQAATGVALMNGSGRFEFVNQYYSDLTGYSVAELLQRGIQDITHPDDLPAGAQRFARLAATGEAFDIEKRYVRKDGSHIWVHNGLTAIRDAEGAPRRVLAVTVDITARKQAEQALREANERKDNFLATLGHELRNPLAPIRNSLAILRATGGTDPTALRVQDMMQRQVSHMVRLVDDLLEVSRISRGSVELRREWVSLATIVHGAVETSRPLIERAGHRLELSLPEAPVMLHADPMRLAQVFANVLNNAAKFTPSASPDQPPGRICLALREEEVQGQREAVVTVTDNGAGLEPHMLERIFDMFTQASPAQGGLGIGLSLARSLVELHGGRIAARSEGLGRGTEFTVRLPLDEQRVPQVPLAPAHEHPVVRQAAATPPPHFAHRRVLVVDDNRDAAESLAVLLRITDADAEVAYDGPSALAQLPRFRPDVVILDLGMPGMDGFEVARRIREMPEHRHVTVIALSGWGKDEDRRRTRAAGFDHHLIKPADIGLLQTLLATRGTKPEH